jgi:hypothetical protein
MNEEFVNAYIEIINKTLSEAQGNLVLEKTRVAIAERALSAMKLELDEVKRENERLQGILNKKSPRVKEEIKEDF